MSYVDTSNPLRVQIDIGAKTIKDHIEAKAYLRLDTGIIARLDRMVRQEFRRPVEVAFVPFDLETCKREIADKLRSLAASTDHSKPLAARAEAVAIAAGNLSSETVAMSLLAEVESIRLAVGQIAIGKPSKSNSRVFA